MTQAWRNALGGLLLALAAPVLAEAPVADATGFSVVPRTGELEYFPCGDCHEHMDPNPERRPLAEAPHLAEVSHGAADLWCTTCHALQKRQQLRTLSGRLVGFDDSYRICRECHSATFQDWQHGAHGKRVGSWRGEREILNCTACHDPHFNLLMPQRRPVAVPGVRAGLERGQHRHRWRHRVWQRNQDNASEGADGQGQETH